MGGCAVLEPKVALGVLGEARGRAGGGEGALLRGLERGSWARGPLPAPCRGRQVAPRRGLGAARGRGRRHEGVKELAVPPPRLFGETHRGARRRERPWAAEPGAAPGGGAANRAAGPARAEPGDMEGGAAPGRP